MMGQLPAAQNALFYDFCIEQHIPANHLLRQINQFLDFDAIKQHLKPFYSHTGRPSIDPELMIRMLLIGYCYGIRSERRLCEEVNFNLAYRWFCQLGLEDAVPDHSTFSKNRHGRFRESDLLRRVFTTVVTRCVDEGLVKGEGFAIDASFIRADVSYVRSEQGRCPADWTPSTTQSRAVKEYLEMLDQEPSLNRVQKRLSLTDPMAQWTGAKGPAEFYYSTNVLMDIEHNIIMDVEATPSTLALEVATTRTMIDRVEAMHSIKPERLLGDTAYGNAYTLGYLVEEKQIAPHVPVRDRTQRTDDTFSSTDFTWDAIADIYHCPAGHTLALNKGRVTLADTLIYRARVTDCRGCPHKQQCCPKTPARKITRSIYEAARDVARTISSSEEFKVSINERKKIEMLFAHMKKHLRFDRLRLRGIKSANDECVMVATAQNLKRLAKVCAQGPPNTERTAPVVMKMVQ